jgi:hypothetical protein
MTRARSPKGSRGKRGPGGPDPSQLEEFSGISPSELAGQLRRHRGSSKGKGAPSTADVAQGRVVQERLAALCDHVEQHMVGRRELAEMVIASLVSGVPMVVLGPPGTGKSQTVRLIAEACLGVPHGDDGAAEGGEGRVSRAYFEYLLTSHTMPEELFGPPDLSQLQQGEFRRSTEGMLPESEFAFLDEAFRASPHIMNTLLSIINERRFHDGATVRRVPLLGVVAASNFAPAEPESQAFFDRFPVRYWVDSVLGGGVRMGAEFDEEVRGLVGKSIALERERGLGGGESKKIACTNDFRLAEALLAGQDYWSVQRGHETDRFRQFAEGVYQLRRDVNLSDRGVVSLWRFGVALDWLRGGSSQSDTGGHLDALLHTSATANQSKIARRKIGDLRSRANHHSAD